jgi:hypothetical protein
MDTCKYVHYEIDACVDSESPGSKEHMPSQELALTQSVGGDSSADRLFPPQVPTCPHSPGQPILSYILKLGGVSIYVEK